MARRKTLMHDIHGEVQNKRALRALYERELMRLKLANEIAKLREERKLTQAQLAKRIGTHQSAIARMEQSTYRGYTLATLAKIGAATGKHLEVRIVSGAWRVRHV